MPSMPNRFNEEEDKNIEKVSLINRNVLIQIEDNKLV